METVPCSAFESVADGPLKNKLFSQNYADGLEKKVLKVLWKGYTWCGSLRT